MGGLLCYVWLADRLPFFGVCDCVFVVRKRVRRRGVHPNDTYDDMCRRMGVGDALVILCVFCACTLRGLRVRKCLSLGPCRHKVLFVGCWWEARARLDCPWVTVFLLTALYVFVFCVFCVLCCGRAHGATRMKDPLES